MSDRQAFIEAISANPFDLTARLVFADWLDEHGEGQQAEIQRWMARAEWTEIEHNSYTQPGYVDFEMGAIATEYAARSTVDFRTVVPDLPDFLTRPDRPKIFCHFHNRQQGWRAAAYAEIQLINTGHTGGVLIVARADAADVVTMPDPAPVPPVK
jgi:uncharacterized protein (TIGR02996 family)